jgi:uncharacterized membrane protein (DUF106 family)
MEGITWVLSGILTGIWVSIGVWFFMYKSILKDKKREIKAEKEGIERTLKKGRELVEENLRKIEEIKRELKEVDMEIFKLKRSVNKFKLLEERVSELEEEVKSLIEW